MSSVGTLTRLVMLMSHDHDHCVAAVVAIGQIYFKGSNDSSILSVAGADLCFSPKVMLLLFSLCVKCLVQVQYACVV